MYQKEECPICSKKELIPIVYGFPGPELFEESEKGLVKLGGCCLPHPYYQGIIHYYCNSCKRNIKMGIKNNKYLFRTLIRGAFSCNHEEDVLILDSKKDNVILNPESEFCFKFSLPYEEIQKIKNILKENPYLLKMKNVPMPDNILDGTCHEFIIWDNRKLNYIETWNLWGWNKENCTSRNIKILLKVFDEIALILKKYEIQLSL